MERLQNPRDARAVLGANPIELEAVADEQRQLGLIGRHPGREGLDPGVELLLRQFLRQHIQAGGPQALASIGRHVGGNFSLHEGV